MKFRKMSVPFAPPTGISGIFGRMESAQGSLWDEMGMPRTRNRLRIRILNLSPNTGLLISLQISTKNHTTALKGSSYKNLALSTPVDFP